MQKEYISKKCINLKNGVDISGSATYNKAMITITIIVVE